MRYRRGLTARWRDISLSPEDQNDEDEGDETVVIIDNEEDEDWMGWNEGKRFNGFYVTLNCKKICIKKFLNAKNFETLKRFGLIFEQKFCPKFN